MSFTAERKLPLPRLHHACAEESQRHEPWVPAPSFCGIPQLDPQRVDEERSFYSATLISISRLPVPLSGLKYAAASLGILPLKQWGMVLTDIDISQYNTTLIIRYRLKPLDIDSTNSISMIFLWYRIFIVRYRMIFDIVCLFFDI